MKSRAYISTAGRLGSIVALTWASNSYAGLDLDMTDFIPAPPGTDAIISYTTFAKRSAYTANGETKIKRDTKLNSVTEIVRYVHYMDLGGYTFAPQVLVPFAHLYDGKIGGASLGDSSGMGDAILAAPLWLLNGEDTKFVVVPYLFAPIGSYNSDKSLNVGENRWKFDLQIGGTQKIADNFLLQGSVETMWYGSNNDASAGNRTKLKQDNSYQAQLWLSYTPPTDKRWTFGAGYSKTWAGEQTIDSIENGVATKVSQARLQVSRFITPTFQLQGLVQRDLEMEGGFKEAFHFTLRVLKVF
ncbi:transporter [Pseudomonas syringae]|uniref:transporter n=1 Tax=Pseudomonas syringae TaxID=317 RepID=UPI0003F69F34|nr:transporter [Pseudomonas syringae]